MSREFDFNRQPDIDYVNLGVIMLSSMNVTLQATQTGLSLQTRLRPIDWEFLIMSRLLSTRKLSRIQQPLR